MTRRGYGSTVLCVEILLQELGPLTKAQLLEEIGCHKDCIASVLTRMKRSKRIHVCGWSHEQEGARRYPRAIYKLGKGVNKQKPESDLKANKLRYTNKLKTMNRTNWVFNLGQSELNLGLRKQSWGKTNANKP